MGRDRQRICPVVRLAQHPREGQGADGGRSELVFVKSDPQLPLLLKLGMPAEREKVAIRRLPGTLFGSRYRMYSLDMLGVIAEIADTPLFFRTSPYRQPGTYCCFYCPDLTITGKARFVLHVWRERVFWRESEAYIEKLWNPGEGAWITSVLNLDRIPPGRRLNEGISVLRGLKIAEEIDRNGLDQHGYPRGSFEPTPSEFRRLALEAAHYLRRDGGHLTRQLLARELGLAQSVFDRYLARTPGLFRQLRDDGPPGESARNHRTIGDGE